MDNKELKKALLMVMHAAQKDLGTLLDSLTDAQKKKRGELDDWSASDILNHISFYNNHFIGQIEAAEKGERVQAADYYLVLNDGIFIRSRDKDFETARSEHRESFEKGLALFEGIDPDILADPKKYEFMEETTPLDRVLGTFGWHVSSHVCDFYCQQDEVEKAAAMQEAMAADYRKFPTWKDNAIYNLACFYSLQGMKEKALENLKIVFKDSQRLRDWSKEDADMDPLRDDPRFQALTAGE